MSKIRFIIETVSSKTDVNGNSYHFCIITSTQTGRGLRVLDTTRNNGLSRVADAIRSQGETYDVYNKCYTVECEVPKRDYQRRAKAIERAGNWSYDHQVSSKEILQLEAPLQDDIGDAGAHVQAAIDTVK